MTIPTRWDLSNVFPSMDSLEYQATIGSIRSSIDDLERFLTDALEKTDLSMPPKQLAILAGKCIQRLNKILTETGDVRAYLMSFVSTDSHNEAAARKMSEYQVLNARLSILESRFTAWVGSIAGKLDEVIPADATTKEHAFALREAAEQSHYLMSASEEALASELSLSGATAWWKLQGTVTSQLAVDFELDGQVRRMPMPALINLHSHPDESVRRRAYEAEIAAWKTVEEPLAACMNGIKGTAVTLNKHRGRMDGLHAAIDMARIDRPTLQAMLGAMENSLPAFRRYFKSKAGRLGKEKLAWWDLFAPTGKAGRKFTLEESRDFIAENFQLFSPELADFARRAFNHAWIDSEQREGKRGGAFCMGVPGVKESRVLCNFDGTLDQVGTIAHELGHAFHNECAFQAGKTEIQQDTPMTLAETASIMCETIVMQAVLSHASDPQEQLAILETKLIGDAQVIVDIYSRYLFEKEVFERRSEAELSAAELCGIMERSQSAAYGDGLDENALHKYMWTWKPHYYYPSLSFYNFPYAFGLLFATGLYAIYQQRGVSFVPEFKDLLASTGEARASDLAARFGIDIHTPKFWEDSLRVIAGYIDRYCAL